MHYYYDRCEYIFLSDYKKLKEIILMKNKKII